MSRTQKSRKGSPFRQTLKNNIWVDLILCSCWTMFHNTDVSRFLNHSPNNRHLGVHLLGLSLDPCHKRHKKKSIVKKILYFSHMKEAQRQTIHYQYVDSMVLTLPAPFFSSTTLAYGFFPQGCLMSLANTSCYRQLKRKEKQTKVAYLQDKPDPFMQSSRSFIQYFQF